MRGRPGRADLRPDILADGWILSGGRGKGWGLLLINPTVGGQAVGMFAVTNIDDIVVLALFFGQAWGGGGAAPVVAGQYLGFIGILTAAVLGAFGAGLLPESAMPYLGLLPLLLGIRAGWRVWTQRQGSDGANGEPSAASNGGPTALAVAAVTFANGGDNIGV